MSIWNDFQGAGVRESYYDANGVRTRAIEAGEGGQRPLLLLHGTTGHGEAYCRNLAELSQDRHVLAVDMLGHGYTDKPEGTITLDDFVEHLVDLADALGAEKVDLSGESLGAMVSAWFAIRHPERVNRILMGTGILTAADEGGQKDIKELLKLTAAMEAEFSRENIGERMRWLVANPDDMSEELIDVRYKIFSRPGMKDRLNKTMRDVLGWLAGEGEAEWLKPGTHTRIGCPTLLLWTTHNPLWSRAQADEAAAEIPDCRFELLDSGHWPQYERAAETNALHREFFRD